VRAYQHGLVGSLEKLGQIYRLSEDKAKVADGRRLVHLFCKPQGAKSVVARATRLTHHAEWRDFIRYAKQDVVAMRELDKKLPRWNETDTEIVVRALDQTINDRGFYVDLDLASKARDAVVKEQEENKKKVAELTDGAVDSATKRDKMLAYILSTYGVTLLDMRVGTLTRRLQDPNLPQEVKDLIELRMQSAGTAHTKFESIIECACNDSRIKGMLQYCGAARTGRWGGRKVQPHNFMRPKHHLKKSLDAGVTALKGGFADIVFDSVTDIASSVARSVIMAPAGRKLVITDLASIEGRVLAWLAGEEWKLQAYRDLDAGIGHDMYILTYARTFNVDPSDVDDDMRQLGKVLELALGYAGGVGAFITFSMTYNVNLEKLANDVFDRLEPWAVREAKAFWDKTDKKYKLSEKVFITCDAIKRMWRAANPAIVKFWGDIENAVRDVILEGGEVVLDNVSVDARGKWVRILLPSGRYICYPGARIVDGKIQSLSQNTYTRKWGPNYLYSGILAENVTQAMSRDILARNMILVEKSGYNIVLHVHDEVVTEVADNPVYHHNDLSSIMSTVPLWAPGLPLNAKGFETYRYKKG
jgi:DNA polymerase